MTATSATQAFADAARAMVEDGDVAGTLVGLLDDCAGLTAADALGILVRSEETGELELLAATSHQAAELELYQRQREAGPGPETIETAAQVVARSPGEMIDRWGDVGAAIAGAGYGAVHSSPMRWRDRTFGALNAFQRTADQLDEDALALAQAFADVATIVIVTNRELSRHQLEDRVRVALEGRVVIEQAKGVLAYRNDIDVAAAYDLLAERAGRDGASLTEAAVKVVREASHHR